MLNFKDQFLFYPKSSPHYRVSVKKLKPAIQIKNQEPQLKRHV